MNRGQGVSSSPQKFPLKCPPGPLPLSSTQGGEGLWPWGRGVCV